MDTVLERERSLKKLHQCIANYKPSQQEKTSLMHSQQEMRDKIELKFKRSAANQNYVFPRKQPIVQEFGDGPEIVDLHKQPKIEQEEMIESKQRPKIKLAKPRTQKRVQTEHAQRSSNCDQKPLKIKIQSSIFDSGYKPLKEVATNFGTVPIVPPSKERVKTEYPKEQQQNFLSKSMKKSQMSQKSCIVNPLSKQSAGSKSKSKLNMLTKSYMHLKNNKPPLEKSAEKHFVPNSIRTSDYKFMPNSTSTRPVTAFNNDHNSTRELKEILHNNQLSATKAIRQVTIESMEARNLQKICSLLPDKKYFRGK